MSFRFAMQQTVKVTAEDITGTVVGRTEFLNGDYMYIVSADGDERQWNEDALEDATP